MLNPESASLYYELTIIEDEIGLIGASEKMFRMAFLWRYGGEEYSHLDGLAEYFEDHVEESGQWAVEESRVLENYTRRGPLKGNVRVLPPQPLLMRFCSTSLPGGQVQGARIWQFHQADADPHPSVPHGHEASGPKKLDAYRGTVFKKAQQVGKEPDKLIVALWNDRNFRDFARKAIIWYMAKYPRFTWRVPLPLRLPRRR